MHPSSSKSSSGRGRTGGLKLVADILNYSRVVWVWSSNTGLAGEESIVCKPARMVLPSQAADGALEFMTPMQVHCAMSVIANDGIMMKPTLVRKVFDQSGKTVVPFPPRPVRLLLMKKCPGK